MTEHINLTQLRADIALLYYGTPLEAKISALIDTVEAAQEVRDKWGWDGPWEADEINRLERCLDRFFLDESEVIQKRGPEGEEYD